MPVHLNYLCKIECHRLRRFGVPRYLAEVVDALSWEVEYVDSVHFRQKELNLVPLAPGEFLHCLCIEFRRNNVPTLSSSSFVTLGLHVLEFLLSAFGTIEMFFLLFSMKTVGFSS